MSNRAGLPSESERQGRLLRTLEQLLAIEATSMKEAMDQTTQLISAALSADKVDIFLHDPTIDSLVAAGTSDTPMGRLQHALGMERLPVANGGRAVLTFVSGETFLNGSSDQDPQELVGVKQGLGVRSSLIVPLVVNSTRRGVVSVVSAQAEWFREEDRQFLEAVTRWVGEITHRAELVERIALDAAEQARRVAADELITILAHDLRTPLTPLYGWVDMIRKSAAQEGRSPDLEACSAIMRGLDRLHRLLADLLDAGRLEQGLFEIYPEWLNLAELVEQTTETLRLPTDEIIVRGPRDARVLADANRLRQALENLLSNARRFSPEGIPIVVELRPETRTDGSWVTIAIQDQGPGIAADLLPRLFSRFGRGAGSRGLGLGLYLARGIAEAHGGTLSVETAVGTGSTFVLSLPIAQKTEADGMEVLR